MIRSLLTVCFLLLTLTLFSQNAVVTDDAYSPHFLGFHTDFDFLADPDAPISRFINPEYLSLGMSWGYGRSWFRPRARASLSWLFEYGFASALGLELPLFETLSDAKSKMFGLYLVCDAGIAFASKPEPFVRFSPHIRIPLGNLEGIIVGASWNSAKDWSILIGRSSGVHPLLPKRH